MNILYVFGSIAEISQKIASQQNEEAAMKTAAQISGCLLAMGQAKENLERIDQYNHLMSIDDFLKPIGEPKKLSLERMQQGALSNISKALTHLQESWGAKLWDKPMTDEDRLNHLTKLKESLEYLKNPQKVPPSSPLAANPKFQANVDKLLLQAEYAKMKIESAIENKAVLAAAHTAGNRPTNG